VVVITLAISSIIEKLKAEHLPVVDEWAEPIPAKNALRTTVNRYKTQHKSESGLCFLCVKT
jgi:hypothetical protein